MLSLQTKALVVMPISGHIKGPLVAAFRSSLMKALDRSVETLDLLGIPFEICRLSHNSGR